MPNSKFTLKDSDRMIREVIEDFFTQHSLNYDYKKLMEKSLLDVNDVPAGYHKMEDGSLMLDSAMPGGEYGASANPLV